MSAKNWMAAVALVVASGSGMAYSNRDYPRNNAPVKDGYVEFAGQKFMVDANDEFFNPKIQDNPDVLIEFKGTHPNRSHFSFDETGIVGSSELNGFGNRLPCAVYSTKQYDIYSAIDRKGGSRRACEEMDASDAASARHEAEFKDALKKEEEARKKADTLDLGVLLVSKSGLVMLALIALFFWKAGQDVTIYNARRKWAKDYINKK